jgi:membrane-associated phospholipid phosphatase
MNLWEWIMTADTSLFSSIHADGAVPVLDGFMKLLREAITWVPLYAFMLYWIIRFGRSYAWQFVLLTIITFAITDFTSASVLKPWLSRLRPCHEPELQHIIRGLVGCGGPYSFPSSHAANHFGLAAFWFWSIYLVRGKRWHWLWFWALAIGYAQVYVGKHYPLDIIAGGLFGYLIGTLCAKLFERWLFPYRHQYQYKPLPGLG